MSTPKWHCIVPQSGWPILNDVGFEGDVATARQRGSPGSEKFKSGRLLLEQYADSQNVFSELVAS